MSTTAPPADDMSITVAPAGVVLVYKPRSMKRLFMGSVCGERSSPAWWCECSLKWHSKGSWSWCRGKRLTVHKEMFCKMRRRWSQWRRDVSYHMMSPHSACTNKQWLMLHHTQTAKSPLPLLFRHPEPVYLCFGFRCHFSCCPDWSTSSCSGATSCGSACCRGNHPRLCSHGGSRWCLLQCTKVVYLYYSSLDTCFCCVMTKLS